MKAISKYGDSNKNIIFLPGGGVDVRSYSTLIKKLSKNYTVYTVNFSHLQTKRKLETVTILKKYFNTLKTDNFILIGHSYGGVIAYLLSKVLDNTKKVILINPSILNPASSKIISLLRVVVKKPLLSIIRYPNLIVFNIKLYLFFLKNLLTQPKNLLSHIKQAIENTLDPIAFCNEKDNIITVLSTNDEIFCINSVPIEIIRNSYIIDGSHDWLMNDTNNSIAMLEDFFV